MEEMVRGWPIAGALSLAALNGCGGQVTEDPAGSTAGDSGSSAASCPGTAGPTMVRLPEGYCIDSTEVTRAQYRAWLDTRPPTTGQVTVCAMNQTFAPDPTCMTSPFFYRGAGAELHPQSCIDWCDAHAYCRAVGKRLCGKIGGGSLGFDDFDRASLSEWHNACVSGAANTQYPYGDTYQGSTCNGWNLDVGATVPVGSMSHCQSTRKGYQGVYDLSGNVWEWEDACGAGDHPYFCRLRGGAFGIQAPTLTCAGVNYDLVSFVASAVGFRCCAG